MYDSVSIPSLTFEINKNECKNMFTINTKAAMILLSMFILKINKKIPSWVIFLPIFSCKYLG